MTMPIEELPKWLPDKIIEAIESLIKEHHSDGLRVGLYLDEDRVFQVVAKQEYDDSGRWEDYYIYVIEGPFGSLWGVIQAEGKTECQDDTEPFGYHFDELDVFKVKTVPTIRYEIDR